MLKYIFSLLFLVFSVSACKKYENGPYFSVTTKKSRIRNVWKIDSVQETGLLPLRFPEMYCFNFSKDTAIITYPDSNQMEQQAFGNWFLRENKEVLELEFMDFNDDFIYDSLHRFDILRLTQRQLQLADQAYNRLYLSPK